MATLKFKPDPTFTARVMIPVHGGDPAPVVFTFKHRTKDAMSRLLDKVQAEVPAGTRSDVQVVQDIASGWDFEEPFTAKNIELLLQNYAGAGRAIFNSYVQEIGQARSGN